MVDDKLVSCPGNEFVFSDHYDSGGAGVVTTTEDYALLSDAFASDGVGKTGERILQKESIEQMRTPQLGKTQLLEYRNRLPGAGDDYSYGLGVRTHVSNDHSLSSLGEFGWDGAAGTYFLSDPQTRLSLFYGEDVLSYNKSFTVIHPKLRDFIYELLFSP
jgi:CubicO group peptidase (beta-lactamase class C family)